MNLFLIPSWYPSRLQPINGIFTQEQAEAIADLCPDINVIVSNWGHYDGSINIRRPWGILRALNWRLHQQHDQIHKRNGVLEVFNPAISWSHRLPFGGFRRLINANRRNFQLATIKYGKMDLIHAHVSYPAGCIALILAKEYKIPYVLTEHMSQFPFPNLIKNGLPISPIINAFENASATIAVSPSLAKSITSFGIRRPEVIPNLVDERKFTLGKPSSKKFVFFTLGILREQKGIDHLLKAIAAWNPSREKYEFRIGGTGPMFSTYQKLAKSLRVSDCIKWLGPVSRNEAPGLFRDCHVFVMPSRYETFGVVFAEAIASGKPFISTFCGGPEFIVNKSNGRLVNVNDVIGLAETMKWMAANWNQFDPNLIRNDFEKRFSRHAVVKQIRTIYKALTGE